MNPTTNSSTPLTIGILGLGYVGCVSAACLTGQGHRVIGVDRDEYKVNSVMDGKAPFYEPGLEELVRCGRADGRLSATTSLAEALPQVDVALVCVGTPSERNGNLGLEQLRRVAEEMARHVTDRKLVVAIRSTVFPGTCEEVVAPFFAKYPQVSIVSNPEFLREGSAVKDFLEPSLLVIGGTDRSSMECVASIYAGLPVEACLVSLRTAEMIKYACNAFHAVKISFANEVGALCGELGVPPDEVMETLCKDVKLNVSKAYLKPGFPFGGSCLPKDLRAIVYRGSRMDLDLPLFQSVLPSNDAHLRRAIQQVMDLKGDPLRIGMFGLAFKENTDDLRESPVVSLLEHLIGKGRDLRVFDPHIQLEQIYGTNRSFILSSIPHIERLMCPALDELLGWASHVVIAQKPSKEMMGRLQSSGLPVVNLIGAM
jgi:GDP-mannose 6-dehydrogenase